MAGGRRSETSTRVRAAVGSAPTTPGWTTRLAGPALVVLVLVAYLPALGAGFIWDDDYYVTNNESLRDLSGLVRIWTDTSATPQYYPLTHTSFWIQYQIGGLAPLPYHLANVLLHGLAAVLLWRVLLRLEIPVAWFGAALFAVHPVHVESVAWITERKNVLSAVFYLAAALVFLSAALAREADRGPRLRRVLAVALYVAALLSKTVTASLPVVLGIVLFWRRGRLGARDLAALLPMLAIGAVFGRLTARLEVEQVLAHGADWSFTFVERCLIAGRAILFYLYKLVLPFGLVFTYPRWEIDASAAWQYLPPLAAVALAAVLAILARRGTDLAGPLVAYVYFAITLFPALGFFNVYPMLYSFVADHFQYLASIGPLALGGVLIGRWVPAWLAPLAPAGAPWLARAMPAAVLAILMLLTFRQTFVYRDLETLWRSTIERNPQAWMAHFNLGTLLYERGEFAEAAQRYREAGRLKPDVVDALVGEGAVLLAAGRPSDALDPLRRAVAAEPANGLAHYNLAVAHERIVLEQQGNRHSDDAIRHYSEAIRLLPEMAEARYHLAVHLFTKGEIDASRARLEEAIERGYRPNPDFLSAVREAQDQE